MFEGLRIFKKRAEKARLEEERLLAEKRNRKVKVFQPDRAHRRRLQGQPCGWCGNAMHFQDIVVVQNHLGTDFAHPRCLQQAIEQPSPTESEVEGTSDSADKLEH